MTRSGPNELLCRERPRDKTPAFPKGPRALYDRMDHPKRDDVCKVKALAFKQLPKNNDSLGVLRGARAGDLTN